MFQPVRIRAVSWGPLLRNAALAFASASTVNLVVSLGAARLLDLSLPEFEPFTWPPIVISTGVGVILAAAAALGCLRFTRRPDRTYLGLIVIGTALSMPMPLSLLREPLQYPGTNGTAVITLMFMHVVVGAAALALRPRQLRAASAKDLP